MPFYTQILSQYSPSSIYNVDDGNILLFPAGPFIKDDGYGGSMLFDSINFFTQSKTENEHIKILQRFCVIYSFLLKDEPLFMFDKGELTKHIQIDSYQQVPVNYENGRHKMDFDNILGQIYFMNNPDGMVSFKELYKSTDDKFLDYFILFLDPVANRGRTNYNPDYFVFDRSYLQIVNYITLLETIIGHDENCNEVIDECKSCGKKGISHRKGSENQWIKRYLNNTIQNETLEKSYFEIIAFARDIRHKTTHQGKLPTAKHIMQDTAFEEYGFDRSKNEYKDNIVALLSIKLAVSDITHYLMLNHFYGLKHFFPLITLKVTSFGQKPT